jgi:hypothetical protein
MNGPPESERPAPPQDRPSAETPDAHNHSAEADDNPGTAVEWVPCTRPPAPQDLKSQLQRRRQAAQRLPPLAHSGRRDPSSRITG